VQRGDQWAQTSRVTNNRTGNTTRVTQGSGGGTAVSRNPAGPGGGTVARTGSGDVYAGRDGNVYRKQDGSWQKYDNGSWSSPDRPQQTAGTREGGAQAGTRPTQGATGTGAGAATRPTTSDRSTFDQLNKDSRARAEGSQRTRDYGNVRSSGATSRGTSSYRPSGGGMRAGGGGGRRR